MHVWGKYETNFGANILSAKYPKIIFATRQPRLKDLSKIITAYKNKMTRIIIVYFIHCKTYVS